MIRARYHAALGWVHRAPSKQPDLIAAFFLTGWALIVLFGGFYRLGAGDRTFPAQVLAVGVLRLLTCSSWCARNVGCILGIPLWCGIIAATIKGVGWPGLLAGAVVMLGSELVSLTRNSYHADRLPRAT